MLRVFLTVLLPLFLPFMVYSAYVFFARSRAKKEGRLEEADWDRTPWVWLGATGLVLVTAVLILLRVFTPGAEPRVEQVEPPRFIDGELQPSRISPRESDEPPPADAPPTEAEDGLPE